MVILASSQAREGCFHCFLNQHNPYGVQEPKIWQLVIPSCTPDSDPKHNAMVQLLRPGSPSGNLIWDPNPKRDIAPLLDSAHLLNLVTDHILGAELPDPQCRLRHR